jgi:hypothetical protein
MFHVILLKRYGGRNSKRDISNKNGEETIVKGSVESKVVSNLVDGEFQPVVASSSNNPSHKDDNGPGSRSQIKKQEKVEEGRRR